VVRRVEDAQQHERSLTLNYPSTTESHLHADSKTPTKRASSVHAAS